ncbi:MAG TPA: dihydroxyacetone kinase subunit DhaL [Candidatus Limnocylindria bacterium]|nr:dihydroxyacetone kinase subunit DhaL [Candidatus Limnocylindria bacterium]
MGLAPAIARRWLELSAEQIDRHASELTALDAAIGDGDHGINLQRGFAAVAQRLGSDGAAGAQSSAAELLRLAGRTLVSTVGGASGPLYGTFFIELGASLDGVDGSPSDVLGGGLRSAVDGVARRGRSTTGEKTMLDALVPGVDAWQEVAAAGGSLPACADASWRAADAGRLATEPMVATKGRASYLGERSRGHVDPGASSATLLMGALAEAIAQVGDSEGVNR